MSTADASVSADDEELSYGFTPSMVSPAHFFRLTPDAVGWEIGRHSGRISYRSIRCIRLSFRPVTLATYRFIAEIWSDTAPKLTIASTSWRSVVEQQRHDAEYAAFIRALHRRLCEAGAHPAFITGSPPFLYWPGAIVCAVLAVGLPYIVVRAALAGATGGAALVSLLLLVFGWQMGNLFWRNRPGVYRPDDIPLTVLPRA